MPVPNFRSEVPQYGQAALDKIKMLPGGTHFVCEAHLLKCVKAQRAFHHRIPQEAGDESSHDDSNIAILCDGCHAMIHRLSVMLSSLSQKSKQSPFEIATEYARQVNLTKFNEVTSNLLMAAQLVAQYRVLKADHAIAGRDGTIMVEGIPRDFFLAFKAVSREIKRGDGKPIGMANLAMLSVLEIAAKHRPELRTQIDDYIHQNVIMSQGHAPRENPPHDDFNEVRL